MAFSDLGKLLEVVEKISSLIERNNVGSGILNEIKNKIGELKQEEGFK